MLQVEGNKVWLGRWGHQTVAWTKPYKLENGTDIRMPTLYMVGGDTSGDGALSNTVYMR